MRGITTLVLLCLTVPSLGAPAAQVQADPIIPGATVRVWVPVQALAGYRSTVMAVTGDTIVLMHDTLAVRRGRTVRDTVVTLVRVGDIERIEVRTGRRRNTAGGVKWGALIGGGVGLVGGIATFAEGCHGLECYSFGYGAEAVPLGAIGGALAGAGIGALVGMMQTVEDWQEVRLVPSAPPRPTVPEVSLRPRSDGIAVTVRVWC